MSRSKVKAKVTIGADGYWSIVRRSAGLARWYPDVVTCAQFQLGGIHIEDPSTNEFYVGTKYAPGGYAWVFPKNEEVANVGLGVRNIHTEPAIYYLKKVHRLRSAVQGREGSEEERRSHTSLGDAGQDRRRQPDVDR